MATIYDPFPLLADLPRNSVEKLITRYEGGKDAPRSPQKRTSAHTGVPNWTTTRPCASCLADERPRERLQHFGPQALSTAELLAIVLRTGTRGDNALDLANKLLMKYGGLPGLVRADFRELCAEHGMGEAKSAQVKAALEIGRRLALVQTDAKLQDQHSGRRGEPGDARSGLPGHRADAYPAAGRQGPGDRESEPATRAPPSARSCAPPRSSARPSSATAPA